MIKLYFAPKVLIGDITEINCDSYIHFIATLGRLINEHDDAKSVFLLTFASDEDEDTEIMVSADARLLVEWLMDFKVRYPFIATGEYRFYFQIYSSFEEAYEVALDMREASPLCYYSKIKQ